MFRSLALCALIAAMGCSTAIEEAESEFYAPIFPVAPEPEAALMPSGAIYSPKAAGLFAADRRARGVGDILMVDFQERFSARKSQGTATSRSDSFEINPPAFIPISPDDLTGSTTRDFSGDGSASQSNSFTGRVSVSVVRVLPGGNLEIMGQKKLTLNNGHEYIRVRGIVRATDISADNIVLSDRIAHADIKYVGAGDVADTAKKGWLRRGIDTVSPL
ncbi:MAG: flagellar basal body L-ring protein FlgH [Rhodobacteraceae bacterium]|nr:flagellar basal body L-ring protein FlgH [Paracoccaceae bacterium]